MQENISLSLVKLKRFVALKYLIFPNLIKIDKFNQCFPEFERKPTCGNTAKCTNQSNTSSYAGVVSQLVDQGIFKLRKKHELNFIL